MTFEQQLGLALYMTFEQASTLQIGTIGTLLGQYCQVDYQFRVPRRRHYVAFALTS
jgi:hypothetical protein